MSRRSVRAFVTGTVLAGMTGLTVTREIPKAQPLSDFACVIRMESHEARITIPRGAPSSKEVSHKVYVLVGNADVNEQNATDHHDDLMQALTYKLRTFSLTPEPVLIDTVATPNETSYVKYIGEILDVQQDRTEQMQSVAGAEAQVACFSVFMITLVERLGG